MIRYNYMIYISALNDSKEHLILKLCDFLKVIKMEYPEIAPKYYTSKSLKSANEYNYDFKELNNRFKKSVVGLFSDKKEFNSCGYTFQYMPEINGCFVISYTLQYSIDMNMIENIIRYDELLKKAIMFFSPEYAFVWTIENKILDKSLIGRYNNFDFIHWRLYLKSTIDSSLIKRIKKPEIGYSEKFHEGLFYKLCELGIDSLSEIEINYWTDYRYLNL